MVLDGSARFAGAAFVTDAFGWPPPAEIRVVTSEAGKHGPELLDQLRCEDEPRQLRCEDLHLYGRTAYGFACGSRKCYPHALYEMLLAKPGAPAQPALFEELPAGVADLRDVRP